MSGLADDVGFGLLSSFRYRSHVPRFEVWTRHLDGSEGVQTVLGTKTCTENVPMASSRWLGQLIA
jgi:hypothetical protein